MTIFIKYRLQICRRGAGSGKNKSMETGLHVDHNYKTMYLASLDVKTAFFRRGEARGDC